MKKHILFLFIISLLLLIPLSASAESVAIISPGDEETQIAPGRDFYVIGEIERGESAEKAPLMVEVELLDADGNVVRSVKSGALPGGVTPGELVMTDYEQGHSENDTGNANLRRFSPPDIIFNAYSRESVMQTYSKIVVTEDYFAAIIFGGATAQFDLNFTDEHEEPLAALEEGEYDLIVRLLDENSNEVAAVRKTLRFGTDAPRLVFNASEAAEEDISEFAEKKGASVINSVVGYWNPSAFTNAPEDFRYIVNQRYSMNMGAEYGAINEIYLLLHALDTTKRDVNLPIGGAVLSENKPEFKYFFYDIGEPEVRFSLAGNILAKKGALTEGEGRFVEILRVESEKNGSLYPDFDTSDGVILKAGEKSVFYGVYSPIDLYAKDIGNSSYRIGEKVNRVKITLNDVFGETVFETECEPYIVRTGSDKEEFNSRFEFSFEITPDDDMALGSFELSAVLLDANGAALAESEKILCTVKAEGRFINGYNSSYWGKEFCDAVNAFGASPAGETACGDTINRGDFAALINRIFGFAQRGSAVFSDIDSKSPYYDDILASQAAGYMTGDEKLRINAENPVTREEAAVILSRVARIEEEGDDEVSFDDEEDISSWAKDYVRLMASNGIISGFNGYFNPKNGITAAEAASLICKTAAWMYPCDEQSSESAQQKEPDVTPGNDSVEFDLSGLNATDTPAMGDVYLAVDKAFGAFELLKDYILAMGEDGVSVRRVGGGLEIRDYRAGSFVALSDEAIELLTKITDIYPSFSVRYNPFGDKALYFMFGRDGDGAELGIVYSDSDVPEGKSFEKFGENWYYLTQE